MTRRDLVWRGTAALVMLGCGVATRLGIGGSAAAIAFFLVSVAAVVVMVNGHHVRTVIRAERSGHALTARAVHAGRARRRAGGERR